MTWVPPNLRTTGYKVPASVWNEEVVGNLLHLANHGHSGQLGDGARLVPPTAISHSYFANTVAAQPIFPDLSVGGGSFGPNGIFKGHLFALHQNTSGANRTYTFTLTLGGTAIAVPITIGSSANKKLLELDFILCNQGLVTSQYAGLVLHDGNAVAAGAVGITEGINNIWNTMAIDTDLLQTLSLTVTMSFAAVTVGINIIGGEYFGPVFGA